MQYHTMIGGDTSKTTNKLERYNSYIRRVNSTKLLQASSKLLFRVTLLVALLLIFFFTLNYPPLSSSDHHHHHLHSSNSLFSSAFYGSGASWEKQVRKSSTPRRPNGFSVLVTGAAGFVGSHCSLSLKRRGDGVLGLDNFNSYYDPSLKRARHSAGGAHDFKALMLWSLREEARSYIEAGATSLERYRMAFENLQEGRRSLCWPN